MDTDITKDSLQYKALERVAERLDSEAARELSNLLLTRDKRASIVILPQAEDIMYRGSVTFHYADLQDLAEPRKYSQPDIFTFFFVSIFDIDTITFVDEEDVDAAIEEGVAQRYGDNPLLLIEDLTKYHSNYVVCNIFYGIQCEAIEFIFNNFNQ